MEELYRKLGMGSPTVTPARRAVHSEARIALLPRVPLVVIAWAVLPLVSHAMVPGLHLSTTPETYVLFLDLEEVETMDNIALEVAVAEKHPANPVLPLGDLHEWDSLQARPWGGTLMYDTEEHLFKCWYIGFDHSRDKGRRQIRTGYATSRDGVIWEKPHLGLYEYNGSRDNNIVHQSNDARVVKDPVQADPAKRYVMLSERAGTLGKGGGTYYPFFSPDGIHWTPGPDEKWISNKLETHQILIDPYERDPRRRFKIYGKAGKRSSIKPGPKGVRSIAMGYGPDLAHITLSAANPILSPNDGREQELHFASVFPYRGYYLMLYDYGRYVDYYGHGLWGAFAGDIRLAVSRDGEHFRRINPDQPLITRGSRGEWDGLFLVVANAVEFKGRIHVYYSAGNENWASWPSDNTAVGPTERSVSGFSYVSQMGLATLPGDGFTYLHARDGFGPGVVTTRAIEVKDGEQAELRVSVRHAMVYRDWVEAEVLDAKTGEPLIGYARADCTDVATDGTGQPVEWGARCTLAGVSAPSIKLRFYLHGDVRLHAFSFGMGQASPSDQFSGAPRK